VPGGRVDEVAAARAAAAHTLDGLRLAAGEVIGL
jgi:hypothetical protein